MVEISIHSHLPSAHFIMDTASPPEPSPVPSDPAYDVTWNSNSNAYIREGSAIQPVKPDISPEPKTVQIEAFSAQEMPFSEAIPVVATSVDTEPAPDAFAADIKESDYDTLNDGTGVANMQEHLDAKQKNELASILNEFNSMFNRVLGAYPYEKVDLELKPNASPIQCKPFTVPTEYRKLFKGELNKLVDLQVLKPVLTSQWAFPSFIIPKKDETARFVSDFRLLNELLLDFVHDLPLIKDVLTRRSGYDYVTIIDLTSQFYHFILTKFASKLCTITTPFGRYEYQRLPMGVKIAPSFAQAVMIRLFRDLCYVECFIDDIAIFTKGTFKDHLKDVRICLDRLDRSNFSIKPKKCFFAIKEVEYLGHIITPDGVKPQPKKVDAILRLAPPSNPRQLRQFIGMVNYYRDHIKMRSHTLTPLTAQTKQKKHITWSPECQAAFQEIKSQLAQNALLSFPDPNFIFVLEPDASDYQLGSIVLQNSTEKLSLDAIIKLFTSHPAKLPSNFKPLAYFSRKLSSAQRNYTTLEKELLSIVESLLEYRSMLLGNTIVAFTDHHNLTFNNQSQRALRWRLVIEEFGVTFIHRAGASNHAADALSRLPILDPDVPLSLRRAQSRFEESYLFYPVQHRMNSVSPITFKNIESHQRNSQVLKNALRNDPICHRLHQHGQYKLAQFRLDKDSTTWKIIIPDSLVGAVIKWFHSVLIHPGARRMYDTITAHFYSPKFRSIIDTFCKTCDICQRIHSRVPKLGKLPPKQTEQNPWEEVQVDLIGPWEFKINSKNALVKFNALTCIDPFTGLLEIEPLTNKTCAHVATQFYSSWLTQYPLPQRCIHDNGSEFISQEFQDLLKYHGIKDVTTTVKNPQANSVIERVHLTIGAMLRAMLIEAQRQRAVLLTTDVPDFITTALKSCKHAINAALHSTNRASPGAFVFNRDMMLPIQCFTSWEAVRFLKKKTSLRNLFHENSRRRHFDWQPGQQVLVSDLDKNKLQPKASGPYVIDKVHTNGTVTLKKGNLRHKMNIRRLKLYRE